MVFGAAAALAVLVGPAQAQEIAGNARLNLLCRGVDTMVIPMNPYYRAGPYYAGDTVFGEDRTPAQLGVTVEGGRVRVKPPANSQPIFFNDAKDNKDGWYDLTDASVDRLSIKGRLKWNRIDRPKLNIDRRNGAVTFGSFTGVCQQVPTVPDATKF
jgi:hypothetical protein